MSEVLAPAADLELGPRPFREPKNKHIFRFAGTVSRVHGFKRSFCSRNKQLHLTLARPVTVAHLGNNCLIANLTLSSSRSEQDIFNSHSAPSARAARAG